MRYNQSKTEAKIRHIDGFVGAGFMKSPDGKMVAEYVQWQNAEKYRAAYQNPVFLEHLPVVSKVANPHPAFFHLIATRARGVRNNFAIELTVRAEPDTFVINTYESKPERAQELLHALGRAHDAWFAREPLLQAAALHQGVSVIPGLGGAAQFAEVLQVRDPNLYMRHRSASGIEQHAEQFRDLASVRGNLFRLFSIVMGLRIDFARDGPAASLLTRCSAQLSDQDRCQARSCPDG